jgi:hypothetical protein
MKNARIAWHIARPPVAAARHLRIESNRRKLVYCLCKGDLERLIHPYPV